MNLRSRDVLVLTAIAVALICSALSSPQAASAWSLNLANADIARAASLPIDSQVRIAALADASTQLNRARDFSNLARIPLSQARLFLASGEPQRAADTRSSAGPALESDSIARFVWADAAWQSNQPLAAYAQWRAGGGIQYFANAMQRAADRHQWNEAERLARIAVGIDPERADSHYVLADALSHLRSGDAEALREIERAAALTGNGEWLSTIFSRKGEILAAGRDWSRALEAFSVARGLEPTDARPRTGYAVTLVQLDPEAHDRALALLTQVTADSPWYTAAFGALADLEQARGDSTGAQAWLEKGLARNPNDAYLLFALGRLYARQNRVDEARQAFILALKRETHADDLQAIARALEELGAP